MSLGCLKTAIRGIGGYSDFTGKDAATQATVFLSDTMNAIRGETGNLSQMERLTWDSYMSGMGKLGYPAQMLRDAIGLAWPFLPESIRTRLQRRASPAAPTPVTPPVKAPVVPSPVVPQARAGWWESWGKYAALGAAGVSAALVGRRLLRRRAA